MLSYDYLVIASGTEPRPDQTRECSDPSGGAPSSTSTPSRARRRSRSRSHVSTPAPTARTRLCVVADPNRARHDQGRERGARRGDDIEGLRQPGADAAATLARIQRVRDPAQANREEDDERPPGQTGVSRHKTACGTARDCHPAEAAASSQVRPRTEVPERVCSEVHSRVHRRPRSSASRLGQQVQSRYAPGSATAVIPSVPALERTSNEKPTLPGFSAMGCSPAPCDGR